MKSPSRYFGTGDEKFKKNINPERVESFIDVKINIINKSTDIVSI